jgi:SAM-dependent methyltransferase
MILNLGCGTKISANNSVVNIDWSILLRIKANPILRFLSPLFLNGQRLSRLKVLPKNIMLHDLSKGIPFSDSSVDMTYSSHVLEHLDREVAKVFIMECYRVLRVGGIIRVVVPDFEKYCRQYLENFDMCAAGNIEDRNTINEHDKFLEPMLLQSVRREAYGTSQQNFARRFVENLILGDARKRGETHQWMYDRFNLQALLESCGFVDISIHTFNTSSLRSWSEYELDMDHSYGEYKPESLYIEGKKSVCPREF